MNYYLFECLIDISLSECNHWLSQRHVVLQPKLNQKIKNKVNLKFLPEVTVGDKLSNYLFLS